MAAAETRLGKPLLLEEFGKRLPPGELEAGAIAKLRDPVYETSFAAVAKSIAMCAVILLLWVHDCVVMAGLTCGHPVYGTTVSMTRAMVMSGYTLFEVYMPDVLMPPTSINVVCINVCFSIEHIVLLCGQVCVAQHTWVGGSTTRSATYLS